MKKQILLIAFCLFSIASFSQTKDYYKDGDTITCKNRLYVFKNALGFGALHELHEIGNERHKYPSRTKIGNHEMNDPFDSYCNIENNKLFYDSVNKILKKYGFEIYSNVESKPKNYENMFNIYFDIETTNWKIISVIFTFNLRENYKASTIPIEAYDELNKMIKNKIRCKPNDMAEKFTYAKSSMRLELK